MSFDRPRTRRTAPRRSAPHPALSDDLAFLLSEANRWVQEDIATELREIGLDWPSRLALMTVRAIGGLSQEALGDRTGIDRSSLSLLARDLAEDGFIERVPHPEDGRKVACTITRAGSGIDAEAQRAVELATRAALSRLTARERLRLEELLAKALGAREQDRHWIFG